MGTVCLRDVGGSGGTCRPGSALPPQALPCAIAAGQGFGILFSAATAIRHSLGIEDPAGPVARE
jgi:hypothetical protein